MGRTTVTATLAAMILGAVLLVPGAARAGGDWNDPGIGWVTWEKGLEAAKKQKKPICVVFYTEWCPHCTNYAKVFHDPQVVQKSKKFVMVRLDRDRNKDLSAKFAPDGQYIPRTFFASPQGELDPSIHAPRPQYKYFYSESDPASVLGGMDQALKKWPGKK